MIETHSAGGIVLNPFGETIVVSQKGLSWSLPKGHIDEGEDRLHAAYREIKEETGIRQLHLIQPCLSYTRFKISLTGDDDTSEKKHLHFFVFLTNEFTLKPEDKDNPEAKWVHYSEVEQILTHQKDSDFFKRHIPIIQSYLDECIEITTSLAKKNEAESIATSLVEKKLVACAQIHENVTSVYKWNNNIEKEKEFKLHLKTTRKHYKAIHQIISDTHSYDCPEFVVVNLSSYNNDYEKWIQQTLI